MSTRNAGSCCLEIEFSLKPGKRREFSRSFEDLICHEGEGHVKTSVFEDREEPGHMIWVATWGSRGALEQYLRSSEFGVLIGGLKVLSTHADCRLLDELQAPISSGQVPAERVPWETKVTRIDFDEVETPKR
jgi:quinol monooxygenase YgiN